MWIAELDTEHFRFRALGATEGKALAALKRGWKKHREQYDGVAPFSMFAEDVTAYEIQPGECFRDFSLLTSARPSRGGIGWHDWKNPA